MWGCNSNVISWFEPTLAAAKVKLSPTEYPVPAVNKRTNRVPSALFVTLNVAFVVPSLPVSVTVNDPAVNVAVPNCTCRKREMLHLKYLIFDLLVCIVMKGIASFFSNNDFFATEVYLSSLIYIL